MRGERREGEPLEGKGGDDVKAPLPDGKEMRANRPFENKTEREETGSPRPSTENANGKENKDKNAEPSPKLDALEKKNTEKGEEGKGPPKAPKFDVEDQNRREGLRRFLQRLEPSPQMLSDLAATRESFGLAWLILYMITKRKVSVPPLHGINLSGTSGLSCAHVHLLLTLLPASVEEMKLDGVAFKDPALRTPFLERLQSAREGRQGVPNLKRLSLAADSVSPSEASQLISCLLSSLEKLELNGNAIGLEGMEVLSNGLRTVQGSSLRQLSLEGCSLDGNSLKALFQGIYWAAVPSFVAEKVKERGVPSGALDEKVKDICSSLAFSENLFITEMGGESFVDMGTHDMACGSYIDRISAKLSSGDFEVYPSIVRESPLCTPLPERPLQIDSLNLSKNKMGNKEVSCLCNVLTVTCFPGLRILRLSACKLDISRIAEAMLLKGLLRLESLDLSSNRGGLESISNMLRMPFVPKLRILNLSKMSPVPSGKSAEIFLNALTDVECPPLEKVWVTLGTMSNQKVRSLGAGRYPAIRDLDLRLEGQQVEIFLSGVVSAQRDRMFDEVELNFLAVNNEGLRMLGEAIRSGRLGAFRELDVYGEGDGDMSVGRNVFFPALALAGDFSLLSDLALSCLDVTDEDLAVLGIAVKAGRLCALNRLLLSGNFGVGREGMEALMGAVVESSDGLPNLEKLALVGTNAGKGGSSLSTALMAGKLKKLHDIKMQHAHLNSEGVRGFASAVRVGALEQISYLDLEGSEDVEREAWDELWEAIMGAEKGLPNLCRLDVEGTTAAGGVALCRLLGCPEKLPAMKLFYLPNLEVNQEDMEVLSGVLRENRLLPCFQSEKLGFSIGAQPPVEGEGGRVLFDSLLNGIAESEKGLPKRVVLSLGGGRVGVEGMRVLGRMVGSGKFSSPTVDLSDTALTDDAMCELGEVVRRGQLCEVSRLDLSSNPEVGRKGVDGFMGAVTFSDRQKSLAKLTSLNVSGCASGGGGPVGLALGSGRFPVLEKLTLGPVDEAGMRIMGKAALEGRLPESLKDLKFVSSEESLSSSSFSNGEDFVLLDALMQGIERSKKGMEKLTSLIVQGGGRLSRGGVLSLSTCFGSGKLSNLVEIDLSECGICDRDMCRLGFGFRINPCPKLETLGLEGNLITAEGVKAFVDLLLPESLPGLSVLRLSEQTGCGNEEEERAFAASMKSLRELASSQGKLKAAAFEADDPDESDEEDSDSESDSDSDESDSDSDSEAEEDESEDE
uniref:Uncharacterized protein n=1 Tax=Chromera velia CCMP2878 TaxID=1169474 RepID=A0A0G4HXR9_9ALVE|eukprot:Cvel_9324.t1-p1 / transcript=Cvel_9324.t1 / gene=Cvel_9324 / organism=Chromera_velia_CCMP2878 / gene_product=hypothetical protein / transcript_product=hypothetical protein / location=Cvel_scaffold535:958-7798(+) / protein_length=1244 / sequence_SO=supercontig / SO=protein_coding / is_pseudo=false